MTSTLVALFLSAASITLEGHAMSAHSSAGVDWSLADSKIISTETARVILAEAKSRSVTSSEPETWANTYDWLAIAVGTGLRVSEVAHIEKDDVLPNRLMVTRRKKRHLSPAPIDVIPEVHEILKRRADAVEIGFIFPGEAQPCIIRRQSIKKGPSVEQVCVGGHQSLRTVQRNWRILVTDLNLYQYGRGIHSLRHTAITNVYKATKDILVAKTFAGHSNAAITERYCHLADLQDALAKVPRVL